MAEIGADILDRARNGDRAAFDELVRFYRDDLLRVTYRFTGNYEDAKDVLQKVLLKVYGHIGNWEPRAPFWSWLYRIAVNESLGYRKREKRRHKRIVASIEDRTYVEAESDDPDPLDHAERSQLERCILEAIDALPRQQRITFVLRYREGLSVRETASILGCAEGTVKANGFHAIRSMRKILRESEAIEIDDSIAL